MDAYQTIIRPLVTEKSTHQTSQSHAETRTREGRGGSYTFAVHTEATKSQIQHAVESIYNVQVVDVPRACGRASGGGIGITSAGRRT